MIENKIIQRVAAKAVIVVNGKVLILHPSKIDSNRKWHIPGGRRDKLNEELENTAKREVFEETKIDLSKFGGKVFMVSEWKANNNGENVQILGVFFRFDLTHTPEVILSNEHDEYYWVDSNTVSEFNVNKEIPKILNILNI